MRNLSLQNKVMVLNISMISLLLLAISFSIVNIIIRQVQDDMGEQAMIIGRIVAQTPGVQQAILSENPSAVLQPLTEKWRLSSGAAFVIVANMDQVRLSHPIPSNVGTPLSNLYREPVLRGEEYLYVAQGSLPSSIRANVPIFNQNGDKQIGFASIGYYLTNVYKDALKEYTPMLYLFLVAIIISVYGSVLIARNIKKSIFGLNHMKLQQLSRKSKRPWKLSEKV